MSVRAHKARDQVQITKVAISPSKRPKRRPRSEKWARVVNSPPKTTPGRKSQKPIPFPAPIEMDENQFPPHDPYAAGVEGTSPYRDPFVRDLPEVTDADRALIADYKIRVKGGKVTDEAYWKSVGFKAVGDPDAISEKKKKDYGFGVPKWSPLYTGKQSPAKSPAKPSSAQKTAQKVLGVPDNLKAKSVNPKPGELSAQQKMNYGFGIPRWSPYAPTGYRVSKGSESHEYGSYTKHDYLIKLAAYLRELAIQSGEDLKMQLDPSFKSLKEAEEKAKREKENAEAMERLSREASREASAENSGAEEA